MISRGQLTGLISRISLMVVCFATAQSSGAQTVQARAVRPASVLGDLADITKANDDNDHTRANAGKPNYAGLSVTLDVGGEQNIIGVIQDHGPWATNYPGAYKVEVSESLDGPWMKTFEGPGQRGVSKAIFEAVRGRFIRVTATDKSGGGNDWSIAELKAIIDPGATARRIPQRDRAPGNPPQTPKPAESPQAVAVRDVPLAFDKNPTTRATTA